MTGVRRITLDAWDSRYAELRAAGLCEPPYGGPLRRHAEAGDRRLQKLQLDNSAAALRLWNFLLTEEQRLHQARARGWRILGTLKDLGTIPVMAYALDQVVAFYPDGAWWLPCIMENQTGLLEIADALGVDESFCPVRAMLGAFANRAHFPIPDLLTCSVGATCDDVSAIAQRLAHLGHSILWWEVPHRRRPESGEEAVELPGGFQAPACQVAFVRAELERVRDALEVWTGQRLTDDRLRTGIRPANRVRALLRELRWLGYTADPCPLPALEMLVAEMLAIHFCSDQQESIGVLEELLDEVRARVAAGQGVFARGPSRADLPRGERFRCASGRDFADPRGEPLRFGGTGHRRRGPDSTGPARGRDRSAADHRCARTELADQAGGTGRNGGLRTKNLRRGWNPVGGACYNREGGVGEDR